MTRRPPNPEALRIAAAINDPFDEAWANDRYDCQVRYLSSIGRDGPLHLSIKRLDRLPVHDWRHFQSIKNEIAGPDREAVEIYPAESRLVDGSNQYHLFVFPEGERIPFGFQERGVGTDADMRRELRARGIPPGKAKQRDWQPGLSTGPKYKPTGDES